MDLGGEEENLSGWGRALSLALNARFEPRMKMQFWFLAVHLQCFLTSLSFIPFIPSHIFSPQLSPPWEQFIIPLPLSLVSLFHITAPLSLFPQSFLGSLFPPVNSFAHPTLTDSHPLHPLLSHLLPPPFIFCLSFNSPPCFRPALDRFWINRISEWIFLGIPVWFDPTEALWTSPHFPWAPRGKFGLCQEQFVSPPAAS